MFYSFADIQNQPQLLICIGEKAKNVLRLQQNGFSVPEGFCLTTEGFTRFVQQCQLQPLMDRAIAEPSEENLQVVRDKIQQSEISGPLKTCMQEKLSTSPVKVWAVRSSGCLEDQPGNSFAGLYETTLDVQGLENLLVAVKACWAYMWHPQLFSYLKQNHLCAANLQMGILFMEMITADVSGVTFTVNPLNSDDKQMIVEACAGCGDKLVSGQITPSQYVYDWWQDQVISSSGEPTLLSPAQLHSVCQTSLQVQMLYGFPVDIEWVLLGQSLHLLQARPITAINYQDVECQWTTADLKDGGVSSSISTPMMRSLYHQTISQTMPAYLKKVNLLTRATAPWCKTYFGRLYWNASQLKSCLAKLPGYIEKNMDEEIGIARNCSGLGVVTPTNAKTVIQGVRVLFAMYRSFSRAMKYVQQNIAQLDNLLLRYQTYSSSPADLLDRAFYIRMLNDDYRVVESTYFQFIYDNGNYKTLLKEYLGKQFPGTEMLSLMGGLENVSHLKMSDDIWHLSRSILSDVDATEYWRTTSVEKLIDSWRCGDTHHCFDDMGELINQHYYRATHELDLLVPRFKEKPDYLFQMVKSFLDLTAQADPEQKRIRQQQRFQTALAALMRQCPQWKRRFVAKKIRRLRAFLWYREALRDRSTHMYFYIRTHLLQLGQHLKNEGTLHQAQDIFFLSHLELLDWLQHEHPFNLPQLNKENQYYQSFCNFENPADIGGGLGSAQPILCGTTFQGIPCSPGYHQGVVKVIKDIDDIRQINDGDILVTKFTDPAWTPIFNKISGVITETGGILSHAAVIAREVGIPAVLAVPHITKQINDLQVVTIDGSQGHVSVHPSRPSSEVS